MKEIKQRARVSLNTLNNEVYLFFISSPLPRQLYGFDLKELCAFSNELKCASILIELIP